MEKLTLHSSSGRDFSYRAGEDGEIHHVTDPTPEQLGLLREYMEVSIQLDPDDDHNIHRVWHDFCTRFMGPNWGDFKHKGHTWHQKFP
ncbi:hypothetical protein LCGC14_2434160 [marine sediment metagenome]|uniref:Uncharacterized protein n=1 Tax=marine sediment metagenome TaxID=412755 RepID=A0A0F9C8C6_9ZZZZ